MTTGTMTPHDAFSAVQDVAMRLEAAAAGLWHIHDAVEQSDRPHPLGNEDMTLFSVLICMVRDAVEEIDRCVEGLAPAMGAGQRPAAPHDRRGDLRGGGRS